ncbi:MAG: hypothetical protein ACLTW6_02525 [Enterobacter sp.]
MEATLISSITTAFLIQEVMNCRFDGFTTENTRSNARIRLSLAAQQSWAHRRAALLHRLHSVDDSVSPRLDFQYEFHLYFPLLIWGNKKGMQPEPQLRCGLVSIPSLNNLIISGWQAAARSLSGDGDFPPAYQHAADLQAVRAVFVHSVGKHRRARSR